MFPDDSSLLRSVHSRFSRLTYSTGCPSLNVEQRRPPDEGRNKELRKRGRCSCLRNPANHMIPGAIGLFGLFCGRPFTVK
ncbi:hypothetical protein SISSUDRAFT_293765 [Sistotremastrum suecicum HHB10207 ss-3]|uniref:Uncharacterized protein n=1 Tax=Sistotremastrum suecicum HHB10207 ss-3 TaxID=1314776 RepID=A0A165ZI08_9AGAM|nr:hypothetical protein SISSUDRAFT_293765 [Sistotremastrum suecicum HHB10207 ss-3]